MSASKRIGFALLVDVIGSTDAASFTKGRDRRLRQLSRRHLASSSIQVPYTITAWDEFQSFAWDAETLPTLILEMRQVFVPWELRIGVGQGAIQGWRSRRPVNEAVGGPAFERAREALESLKGKRSKYRRLTLFRTGNQAKDRLLDLVYGLHDTLVEGVTDRQWETIALALKGSSNDRIAAKLGVTPSTVTRNLQRGHYWQMLETRAVVAELLAGQR